MPRGSPRSSALPPRRQRPRPPSSLRGLTEKSGDSPAPEVGDDLARCVVPWHAGDAAARMGSRAAHVQSLERSTVVPVPEHRPRREQLIEAEGAVEDVATHQTEGALEVQRAEYLPPED